MTSKWKPNHLFRSARLRQRSPHDPSRSISRQELADVANGYLDRRDATITGDDVARIEQGRITYPRAHRRKALRQALGAVADAEIGLVDRRALSSDSGPAAGRTDDSGQDDEWGRGRSEQVLVGAAMDARASDGASVHLTAQGAPTGEPGYASTSASSHLVASVGRIAARAEDMAIGDNSYQHVVQDLIEWAVHMKRRDILQWLSWAAGTAAAAPVLHGLDLDERERTAQAIANPSRVDGPVVDHIDHVLWRCMRQDDVLGPQASLDTVLAQRNLVQRLLPAAAGPLHTRLLSLYANLSRFAGWLCFDLSNYSAASFYYETARAAAHDAENTELGAFVLCNMSHLATWRGQPRIGIDHAVAAQGWASLTDDRQLQAYAFDVAARAYAKAGRRDAAEHSLDQAERTLDDARQPSPWVYFFNSGQLTSTRSTCHLDLGAAEHAVRTAEASMTLIDSSFVRNLAITSTHLGVARLRMKKPDVAGGAAAIADAGRLASHNRSTRLVEKVRSGVQELSPWRAEPEVKDALDQLAVYGFA